MEVVLRVRRNEAAQDPRHVSPYAMIDRLFGFVSPWVRFAQMALAALKERARPRASIKPLLDPLTYQGYNHRSRRSILQGYAGDPDRPLEKDQSGSPCRPCARPSETSTDTFSNVH